MSNKTEQEAKRVEEAWNTLTGSGESVPTGQLWDALWDWMEARRLDRETPEPDQSFTQSFQAEPWALAFIAIVRRNPSIATDEGTMLGWFANAIMRGYDERVRESKKKLLDLAKQIEELPRAPLKIEVPLPSPDLQALREKLAAYAHEAWCHWMRWMLPKMSTYIPGPDDDRAELPLVVCANLRGMMGVEMDEWFEPRWHHETLAHIKRWRRQMETTFHELSVHEQMSDLDEADKMLAIMRGE